MLPGFKTTLKKFDVTLHGERRTANELQAALGGSGQPMWHSATWPDYLRTTLWAPEWTTWMNIKGESGEEPPAAVQRLIEAHQGRVAAVPASEEDLA